MPDRWFLPRAWRPVVVLVTLMLAVQAVGPEWLAYDRRSIASGELWRLLSGHLVHANLRHWLLNAAGLLMCQALTGVNWSFRQWGWRILWLAMCVSAGFWLLQPGIEGYVGFSGVLLGLFLLAAAESFDRQRWVSGLLVLILLVKILMEQLGSVRITSSEWIGVPVLVDAHLYGFVAGLVGLLLQRIGHHVTDTINS